MSNDVTTTFFANAQAAEAAIAKLEKKYDDLENKLKQVAKTSKSGSDSAVEALGSYLTGFVTVTTAVGALTAALNQAYSAQSQLNQQADTTIVKYDELIRKLRVQAGLTVGQGAEAQGRLTEIAKRTGVDFSTAQAASEEMISQGFDASTGTGKGVERLLQTIKATNANEAEAKQIAAAYAALLAATGQEKNQENLEKVTLAVQRTFKGTPLQAGDLAQLAPKIQGVSQAVPWDEALAQFAVMKEKSSPDVASTGLKIFWERMQTAGNDNKSQQALAQMGLTADQVDAIGEKPSEVLDRLAAGLDKLKPEQRAGVMKDLFGQEAMSAATGLIRDRDKVQEFLALQGDEAGFQEDVRVKTSGAAAAEVRAKLADEQYKLRAGQRPGGGFEEDLRAAMTILKEQDVSPTYIDRAETYARRMNFLGFDGASTAIDYETLERGLGANLAEQVMPAQYVQAKRAELRGLIPGGATAEQFLQEAANGLEGEANKTAALQQRIDALQSQEGGSGPKLEKLIEATDRQTEMIREFLEQKSRKPDRNPAGGE